MFEEEEDIPRLPTPPSPLPQPIRSQSESFRPARPRDIKNVRSLSHSSRIDLSDWEIEELEELHKAGGRSRKREKPTSPALVVFYVVCLYMIVQIFSRVDDLEDLLPNSSTFRQSHSPHTSMEVPNYPHMPYGFPHVPNPLPSATPLTSGTSWWRVILGVLFYPIYLLMTILITPLPLLLNLLYLLAGGVAILLYPIIGFSKILYRAFILGPVSIIGGILEAFYPLWVLVGAVIFFGCLMGLSTGWIGKLVLNTILGWKERREIKAKKLRDKAKKEKEKKKLDLLFEQYEEIERFRQAEIERHAKRNRENILKNSTKKAPILNIGMSNLRGTKKDEKTEKDLVNKEKKEKDFQKLLLKKNENRDIFKSTGRENLQFKEDLNKRFNLNSSSSSTTTTNSNSNSNSSENFSNSNGILSTTTRKFQGKSKYIDNFEKERFDNIGLKKNKRKLTSEENDKLVRGENVPVLIGMRRRGIKETYVI
ncbi:uncharacterized protein I206_100373 [Kwoniella pini CBS 10737]|uniref:Uncharacterized protein n=1 Tax=Kwoniella pini CBS 10737 TaxID=1296096 RepID=A0A1B9IDM2_9TREE|nr:uncharacterized protein I206_00952 [Kwoniella pini CBS 10737]OCF53646.1 hypothetical protein I206_00952 [Kwoniella pini CBS 10737]